ncbi:MAG: hypothetical protein IKY66_03455 [Bacteroidales bacterium]|nr:hypothetical protein [Bacteroidales bacterium]
MLAIVHDFCKLSFGIQFRIEGERVALQFRHPKDVHLCCIKPRFAQFPEQLTRKGDGIVCRVCDNMAGATLLQPM